MKFQGHPCWYELGTSDPDAAASFYQRILGWSVGDSGMEGFDYRLAKVGDNAVAGLMNNGGQPGNPPPNWLVYYASDDIAVSCARITAAGGKVLKGPEMIPGTGLYAVVTDPQGAHFGMIQPDMSGMSAEDRAKVERGEGAFNQSKAGHGCWNELMTPDPDAGYRFYADLFGWTKGQGMDMGEMGIYQLVRRNGADIGAIMAQGNAPVPVWMPYFNVATSATATVEAIRAADGQVHHGPAEVPGPAYIAVSQDPQGAWFGTVSAQM